MRLEQIIKNSKLNIEHQKELAKEGKDFSTVDLINSERMIEVANIGYTMDLEDWKRIHKDMNGVNDREKLMACKDIKEKYALSWSELETLAHAQRTSESVDRAVAKYTKANCVQIHLKLNKRTDADILAKLDEVESKQGYIKELIRRDIVG